MAQHNPNDDGEPGPTQVERSDDEARASDVESSGPGAAPEHDDAGERTPPASEPRAPDAGAGEPGAEHGVPQGGGPAVPQGGGPAVPQHGEQGTPQGAEANPWARPGSAPVAGSVSPAPDGADADVPTGQHAAGRSAADQAAADQPASGPPAEARFATDPYATVPYPAGQQAAQYPGGPYQPGSYQPGQYPPGPYPAASYQQGAFAGAATHATPYPTAPYQGPPYPPGPYPGPAGPPAGPGRGGHNRTVALIVAGIVIALLAGAIGGAIGAGTNRQSTNAPVNGGVLAGPLPDVDPGQPLSPVEQVAARVLPSVVQIRVEGGTLSRGELGEGSGMVVSGDGLVLTNNHVVEPAAGGGTLRAVLQDGRTVPVRIIGRDPQSDVALVKADNVTGLTPIELGNSDGVRVGQQVAAVGSPLGLGGSVTTGIISALNRAVSLGPESGATSPTVLSALQTDAAINPGNSGGPLVDMQGRVVGINSAIATAGPGGGSIGVGFAIPVNQAKRIADQLRTTGRATHAVLGVEVADDPQQTGARLRTVTPDGPGARAGLRVGDLVVRFGGRPVTSGEDLQAAVRSQVPGAVVEVQLSDRTTQVTLGEN